MTSVLASRADVVLSVDLSEQMLSLARAMSPPGCALTVRPYQRRPGPSTCS